MNEQLIEFLLTISLLKHEFISVLMDDDIIFKFLVANYEQIRYNEQINSERELNGGSTS